MENTPVKLPEGFHDLGEDLSAKGAEHIAKVEEEADTHIHYPTLWFHEKEMLRDLPKEGTATIHYKKIMEREETITVNGKKETRYTVELQIHGLKPGESTESEEESNEPNDEDAIEKGLQAASSNS